MRNITLPMSEADAESLKLGEMVTVSGLLFTGRSRFHIRAIEDDVYPPIDYEKINCFFHVGPVMRQTENGVRKFRLRTLIGKTTMGPATAQALKEVRGVYLSKIGLSGNALRGQVKKVHDVYFLDELGKTECTWIYEVENFGPFFVAMDANGRNYFEELSAEANARMPEIEKALNIPADYQYTEVNG